MLVLNVRSIIGRNELYSGCYAGTLWAVYIWKVAVCAVGEQQTELPDYWTIYVESKNRGGTLVLWPLQYIICVVFVYLKYTHGISIHIITTIAIERENIESTLVNRCEWNGFWTHMKTTIWCLKSRKTKHNNNTRKKQQQRNRKCERSSCQLTKRTYNHALEIRKCV